MRINQGKGKTGERESIKREEGKQKVDGQGRTEEREKQKRKGIIKVRQWKAKNMNKKGGKKGKLKESK